MRFKNKPVIKISLLFTFYCLLSTPLYARLGGCTAPFLSIGGGARALALGGAYSAFAEGIDAIYWNPAGIAKISTPMVNFVHVNLFPGTGISNENFAFTTPIKGGALGISAIALLSGEIGYITERYQQGSPIGTTYSANDFAVGLSYAVRMTDKFSAGLTLKGINQNIGSQAVGKVSANGIAFDVGGTYNTGLKGLRFGFMIQNFGPDIAYGGERLKVDTLQLDTLQDRDVTASLESDPDPLPLSFQMGIAMDVVSTPLYKVALTGDLVHLSDQEATFALGTEFSFLNDYFVRLGCTRKNNTYDKEFDWLYLRRYLAKGFTCGVGITVQKFIIDYTYQAHQYLSGIHRVGLSLAL